VAETLEILSLPFECREIRDTGYDRQNYRNLYVGALKRPAGARSLRLDVERRPERADVAGGIVV
jgi:hypothetical protein